jgi:hypothetical protein
MRVFSGRRGALGALPDAGPPTTAASAEGRALRFEADADADAASAAGDGEVADTAAEGPEVRSGSPHILQKFMLAGLTA